MDASIKQNLRRCAIIGAKSFKHMSLAHMKQVADAIDRLTTAVGRAAAWLILFVVAVQFALVVARYAFDVGSIRWTESVIYADATLFLLAAAWTLRAGGHVRVDVFYAEASPRAKAWIDLLGALLLLLPFALVLLWLSVPFAQRSWAILERSQETSGLPLVFLLKTLIPLFAAMLALQGVSQVIRALIALQIPPVTPGLDPGVHSSSQDGLPGQPRQ
jgi:TRAP-type mannitol/chloroaromatic compound transport system permease small subunit